jgi:hypothetical protein
MKKGLILITVILFVLILALRYVEEKSGRSDRGSAIIQTEKGVEGVSLPKGSDSENLMTELEPESYDGGLVSYGDPLTLSEGEEKLGKACKKGSIKDIYIAHGQIWGYGIADSRSFNVEESKAIYSRLAEYTACRAAAKRSVLYCNRLPAGVKGVHDVPARISSQYQCIDIANNILFSDFMAGNVEDKASCFLLLSGDAFKNIPIPGEMFCNAAKLGLENMCESFKKQGVKGSLRECYEFFPRKVSDCNSDHCKIRYDIYQAIKSKKAEQCPDAYKAACKAYLSKSVKPCDKLASNLSKTYCNFLKRVNKASGNYPGMNDEEIKQLSDQLEEEAGEERKLKEKERLVEDQRKKESEKITKEINAKVKKLLGKE